MKTQRKLFERVLGLVSTNHYSSYHRAGSTAYYTPFDGGFIIIVDYERNLARATEYTNMTDLKASKRFVT